MSYNSSLQLKEYWLAELGCREEDLLANQTVVCQHGTLKGYNGIMVLRTDKAFIISAPEILVDELTSAFRNQPLSSQLNPIPFQNVLGKRFDRSVGPAWLGGLDTSTFRPLHDTRTAILNEWDLFEEFIAACSQEDVEVSSLKSGREPVAAVFEDDKIAAAAGSEVMENIVAHVGILTRPEFRGKGFAKHAISAIVENAMQRRLGIQYWTLSENLASIHAATSVGITKFAETLAIRMRES